MSDTVTIPADVAKRLAEFVRDRIDDEESITSRLAIKQAADLLDPKPPTLREQVASKVSAAIGSAYPTMLHDAPEHDHYWADAILAVVRDTVADSLGIDPGGADGWHDDTCSRPAGGLCDCLAVDLLALLDPKPPTLREQVALALWSEYGTEAADRDVFMPHADVALAIVRSAVAALPTAGFDVLNLLDGAER
jgi:hypothetical protein